MSLAPQTAPETAPQTATTTTGEDLTGAIVELLAQLLAVPAATVPADVTLADLDIDSIVIVELVLAIQTALDVHVPLGVITPDDTAADVARHVVTLRGEAAAPSRPEV